MTDQEFIEYLVAKLSVVDDTCAMCEYSPSNNVCLCVDRSICTEGIWRYAEAQKEMGETKL